MPLIILILISFCLFFLLPSYNITNDTMGIILAILAVGYSIVLQLMEMNKNK